MRRYGGSEAASAPEMTYGSEPPDPFWAPTLLPSLASLLSSVAI